jgi:hypothetical protein
MSEFRGARRHATFLGRKHEPVALTRNPGCPADRATDGPIGTAQQQIQLLRAMENTDFFTQVRQHTSMG